MTVDNTPQQDYKNPSVELIQMIHDMVMTYKKTLEERNNQVKAIIDKGRQEELSDKQIRDLIETALKKFGLSDRTIYRALPDELKDKTKQRANSMRRTIKPKHEPISVKQEPEVYKITSPYQGLNPEVDIKPADPTMIRSNPIEAPDKDNTDIIKAKPETETKLISAAPSQVIKITSAYQELEQQGQGQGQQPKLSTSGTAIDRQQQGQGQGQHNDKPLIQSPDKQQVTKRQADITLRANGSILQAFKDITEQFKDLEYKKFDCKMGLVIYYI